MQQAGSNLWQVVHTRASVHQAKGWRRSAAGKVTVGLASHWPCITDSVVYPPEVSTAIERDKHPVDAPCGVWHSLLLPYRLKACLPLLMIASSITKLYLPHGNARERAPS